MKHMALAGVFAMFAILVSGSVLAKTCELSIEANDRMQYNKSELTVDKTCDQVKLTLTHTGVMDVGQMGHNWVLTRAKVAWDVAQAGHLSGAGADYVPRGDERVLAHTDLIGGGQTTSVTFDLSGLKPGGDYKFFCSFPGHFSSMNGKFIIE